MKLKDQIQRVFIHPDSQGSRLEGRALNFFSKDIISYAAEPPLPKGRLSSDEFDYSKRTLFIKPFKGKFFKRCPGGNSKLACCNYFVLNLGQQCNFNCSYCYLQSFLNTGSLILYSNLEDAFRELESWMTEHPNLGFRVGTGEVVDSLSMDELTGFSVELIRFFKKYPNLNLEFKTKSDQVDLFLDEPHGSNVTVSWSINPQAIIEKEEHGTASLDKRLSAARKCKDKNFKVGFHIDPMIWTPDWKDQYRELVSQISKYFEPKDVPYMSVGSLRFQPEQRHMMKERFPMKSLVNTKEMSPGPDGKLRYAKELRQEMYQFLIREFKGQNSAWNIFMCMEAHDTWLAAYEKTPRKVKGLEDLFSPRPSI